MATITDPAKASDDYGDWSWSGRATTGAQTLHEWASKITQEIAEMTISSEVSPQFAASWTHYGLGAVELNFLRCSPQTVTRSREMVARGSLPNFELLYARSGAITVNHGEHCGVVPPGCFVLLDDQRAYDLDFPDGSDCLTVRMPEIWLRDHAPAVRNMTGQVMGLRSPWGRPLAGMLTAIADGGLPHAMMPRTAIADQLGAMVSLLAGEGEAQRPAARGIERRAQDVICALYADPALDPARVARELGIGVRHLHRVMTASGDSFGKRLNAVRVAAAQALLTSRDGQDMPIGEVAWRVGFADQSHFARLFRTAHGCTPSRFRDERDNARTS